MKAQAMAIFALLLSARDALAAGSRTDTSDFLIWGFLGFCAVIVVAELIPLVPILRKKMQDASAASSEPVEIKAGPDKGPGANSSH